LLDDSSSLIRFDPTTCILCDRCSRACNEVKHNLVIGRSGKGYAAHIAFDLADPMGTSSCVECGECMLSCPTTALTFHEPVEKSDWFLEQVGGQNPVTGQRHNGIPGKSAVAPAEMDENIPRTLPAAREWNQYSVVRWQLKPGILRWRLWSYAFLLQSAPSKSSAAELPILLTPESRISAR
jgi:ferredoxin